MANLQEISWYFPGTGIPVLGKIDRSRSISVRSRSISVDLGRSRSISTLAESHHTKFGHVPPNLDMAVSTLAEAHPAALLGQRLGRARYVSRIRRRMLSLGNPPDLYEVHHIRPKGRKIVFLVPKCIFHRGQEVATKLEN
jgi:hypothetical protein